MDQIRIWQVVIDELSEWFETLDTAIAYLRAEIKSGKEGGRIESRFVSPEEFARLLGVDDQRAEDLNEEAKERMHGICAELAGAIAK